MTAFLVETLEELLRHFIDKFLLKRVLEKAPTSWTLIKLDVEDKKTENT